MVMIRIRMVNEHIGREVCVIVGELKSAYR